MRGSIGWVVIALAACSGGGGPPITPLDGSIDAAATPIDAPVVMPDGPAQAHHARFVGMWAVEQPNHALYEVTYYTLAADGVVTIGPSEPPNCGVHLERHCVTGSVARCTPPGPGQGCTGLPSCVFGTRWHSVSERVLVFAGVCSDQTPRDIVIELAADPSRDTAWGGAGGTLLSVGGETNWVHDNWEWAFRKCPPGTTPATCFPP